MKKSLLLLSYFMCSSLSAITFEEISEKYKITNSSYDNLKKARQTRGSAQTDQLMYPLILVAQENNPAHEETLRTLAKLWVERLQSFDPLLQCPQTFTEQLILRFHFRQIEYKVLLESMKQCMNVYCIVSGITPT